MILLFFHLFVHLGVGINYVGAAAQQLMICYRYRLLSGLFVKQVAIIHYISSLSYREITLLFHQILLKDRLYVVDTQQHLIFFTAPGAKRRQSKFLTVRQVQSDSKKLPFPWKAVWRSSG